MWRLALYSGLVGAVVFWAFLLTGHGENTELFGVLAFALIILGLISKPRPAAVSSQEAAALLPVSNDVKT